MCHSGVPWVFGKVRRTSSPLRWAKVKFMCGFAGVFGSQNVSTSALQRMGGALEHRGPDDHRIWHDQIDRIGLAHTRLSIIDLSPAGSQPMISASGRFVIAYNGEIYNHLGLRKELQRGGLAPAWNGRSDTETLLAGFEAYGIVETLKRTIGMFAFAVWDRRNKQLSLARDRLGEKPLYYGWQGEQLFFGSELKALEANPSFQRVVDVDSIASYMRFGYIPAPGSIYLGVRK